MKTYINKEMVAALFFLMLNYENGESKENKLKGSVNLMPVAETALKIEDWMIDEQRWSNQNQSVYLLTVNERALAIEDWMLNEDFSNRGKADSTVDKDTEMRIESWMVDPGIWEKRNEKPE